MPSQSQEISVTTDDAGAYTYESVADFPGPGFLPYTLSLRATVVAPEETTVHITLDIDGADGFPQNDERSVDLTTGAEVDLGAWRVDGGDIRIRVSGTTDPPRPQTQLTVRLSGSI